MKPTHSLSPSVVQVADSDRKKRLGQFFTGTGLGRLLAAFAQAEKAKTIIDPMAGSGDLLASCLEIGAKPEVLAGIEIDELAYEECQNRLPIANCLLGNAFSPETISNLPKHSWDLVIANPPYVRYQSFSNKADATHEMPTAQQIRQDLLLSLQLLPELDDEDKLLFARLVNSYSGLSDLAVPAWILCAGLVKKGGKLALVVPESWLSRDYATIVHYLLFRWFDIEFVVEDEHASWFDDVQVKTTLIVAKRVQRRASALSRSEGENYCHIAISAVAANSQSPIGRLVQPSKDAEKRLAKQARQWLNDASSHATELVRVRPISLKLACKNVIAAASRQKWFALLGEGKGLVSESVYVPHEIHDCLSRRGLSPVFDTFESQEVAVGQGLRTGANGFFYADGERHGDEVALMFSGPLSGLTALAPSSIAKPVLRRQSELPDCFSVSSATTKGYLLDLRGHVLLEDIEADDLTSVRYKPMPMEVAAVVKAAARANFGTAEKPKKVFELTAVSPNTRSASRSAPARHWYMLPDFASRHRPDVLLARVNSTTPRAYLNENRECLIDANFSTIWTKASSKWSAYTILAFMNSAWAQAVIEYSGSVMGGGALKVEATHLRRVPIPRLNEDQLRWLDELGARLAKGERIGETITAIDTIIAASLGWDEDGTRELRNITIAGRTRRAKHKKK
ncbi:tRNA1(Val) (adenine(37)-N6)-methyltransferase [compost metagenome]